ncbi:MAG: molybdenum cofactor biosynthesis protein MoaE, partial [Alphaproteobacteria bacterium]
MSVHIHSKNFDPHTSLRQLSNEWEHGQGGALASFIGIARRDAGKDKVGVAAIVLEHYPGMTERALLQLENQARQRWSLLAVRIEHRVGRVEVGQPIVLVAAVAEHREPALKACEFLINALKTYA